MKPLFCSSICRPSKSTCKHTSHMKLTSVWMECARNELRTCMQHPSAWPQLHFASCPSAVWSQCWAAEICRIFRNCPIVIFHAFASTTQVGVSLLSMARRILGLRMEETLQIWRVSVNILNKPSRRVDSGWSSSLGFDRVLRNVHIESTCY
jgi:hypothetical protein